MISPHHSRYIEAQNLLDNTILIASHLRRIDHVIFVSQTMNKTVIFKNNEQNY